MKYALLCLLLVTGCTSSQRGDAVFMHTYPTPAESPHWVLNDTATPEPKETEVPLPDKTACRMHGGVASKMDASGDISFSGSGMAPRQEHRTSENYTCRDGAVEAWVLSPPFIVESKGN